MNNFVFKELDNNRIKFNGFGIDNLLKGHFEDILPWYDLFVKYCEDNEIEITITEQEVLKSVKTYLGLQLFGENTFNLIKNQDDLSLDTAIKTLDSLSKID
jgi:hypothetical protein